MYMYTYHGILGDLREKQPRPGSVVVERSPGMRKIGGSIPDRVKQKRFCCSA